VCSQVEVIGEDVFLVVQFDRSRSFWAPVRRTRRPLFRADGEATIMAG
jgi:hypothetical protein